MDAFWLSLHVPYRCRDSGVCCSSAWEIPVEKAQVPGLARLRRDPAWLRPAPHAPCGVAGVLAIRDDGHCVFHQTDGDRRGCEIQHAWGHDALPAACRHFPREYLIDRRGIFVTLSHYCPTAADLLFAHRGPVHIVARPTLSDAEGLDARGALPPSLTPGMLMDDAAYGAWEAHMIARLAGDGVAGDTSAEACLAHLRADASRLASWRPGGTTLADAIARLPPASGEAPADRDDLAFFAMARAAVPAPHAWPDAPCDAVDAWRRFVAGDWPSYAPVVRRFLAAHAFAAWIAYQGNGLRSVVRRLDLALAVLRVELARECARRQSPVDRAALTHAIRQTDLLLVHLADRMRLAEPLRDRTRR